ncbi:MAG: alpha-L-rhamnosidase C-terminal domain-containing protein [Paenibacillaceae bacterium]
MNTIGYHHTLPKWVWHAARENRPNIRLSRIFKLELALQHVTFHAAFTGAATIILDGTIVATIHEQARNVEAFIRIIDFPERLEAGEHEVRIEIECTEYIPLQEVNSYLWDRRVGAIAFLQAENEWFVTDERWETNGEPAAIICRLGEEPFGDLDNGPEWFVRGGFEDIVGFPLEQVSVIAKSALLCSNEQGTLSLTGCFAQDSQLDIYHSDHLLLFYHLRKQEQWAFMRNEQNKIDLKSANWLLVDLGAEYNSRFYVKNKGSHTVNILWNGAESLQELEHYNGCITEIFEVLPGQMFFTLPQGMRYIRLYLLGTPELEFHVDINFQSVHVALEQVGLLQSDTMELDRIYDVAAHTSLICHQIGLWDGIKRDRLNWTFDFYLAAKSCYYLWSDYKVIRRAVSELGMGTPYGYWMNGICEYTLWWVKTICEYHFHTGDKTFVIEMAEPLQRHIRWIEDNVDPVSGGLRHQGNVLIEWVPLSDEEKQLGLQAIYALTSMDLQKMIEAIPELNIKFNWPLSMLSEDQFMLDTNQLATKVLGIASGYVSEHKSRMFLEQFQLQDPFTPLSAYQLAECYSQYGMHDRAYDIISTVWGGMVNRGATTFWEAFTLSSDKDFHDALTTYTAYESYRMSLCHAWSSTPVKWISEVVLGIKAVEPGFTKIQFQPVSVGGIRECKGTVNSPHGPIQVYWKLDENDVLQANIQVPQGIQVIQ